MGHPRLSLRTTRLPLVNRRLRLYIQALAGGTLLTIDGVNLSGTTSVLIGGKPATNVTVTNSTQVTCITPSSSVYGTAAVVVQTPAGSTTNLNSFSYGTGRGNGMTLVSAIGGRANGVAVQGNYAYVGEGSSFVVEDVSNPATPTPMGRLAMPGIVQDIVISGSYAFVANDDAGLQVVDVSTPTVPKLVGFYDVSSIATGIAVLGSTAYLSAGNGGLIIFDISAPTKPTLLSATALGATVQDVGINAAGTVAYCLVNGNLVIVDATTPTAPIVKGSIGIGSSSAACLAVAGTRVFVAGSNAHLKMIDVSNPNTPVELPRDGVAAGISPLSVAASNNLVYAAGGASGFLVFNYGSGTLTNVGSTTSLNSSGTNMTVIGTRAYLAGGANGLFIVDAASSTNPSLLGTSSALSGDYGSVALSGNYAYVYANQGFRTYDVTNPALPVLVGHYTGLNNVSQGQVLVSNSTAYRNGYGSDTTIVNVTNPASPTLRTTIPATTIGAMKMALSGNSLFIAGWDTSQMPKLVAFDVSNPSSPTVKNTLSFAGNQYATMTLALNAGKALVGLSNGLLKVVDVSNPNSMAERGTLSNIGSPYDIAMSSDGHYGFLVDGSGNSLRVVDVSDAMHPSQIANISLPFGPGAITVNGSYVYVAGASNVWQFDVSTPASPVMTRSYSLPSRSNGLNYGVTAASDVADASDLVFVGDFQAGLVVLETADSQIPTLQITGPTSSVTYSTNVSTLNLAGSANDNQGVTRVTWSNDRGGGGDATGTTSWSVSNIPLASGTNVVTVVALDRSGNVGTATLTVTCTPPDSTPPIVNIATPNPTNSVTTSSSTIALQGYASDNVGIAGVQWSNDRGGSGNAMSSTSWTTALIPLQLGPNNITVTASDAAGNTGSASIAVNYTPRDITPPSVTIQFPTLAPVFSTNVGTLNISGIASDDRSVSQVTWSNDQGGQGTADGTEIWSINGVSLQPGLNVITVTVLDAAGDMQTDSLAMTYTPLPVPQITSPMTASARKGQFFAYLITADNTPGAFGAAGLPAGLILNSSIGLISGIPSEMGSFNIVLSATNGGGNGQTGLVLSVASPYTASENWRVQNFGVSDNSGDGADLANPWHDGIPNLIKYALVLDPTVALANALPSPHVRHDVEGDRMSLSFYRDPTRSDINIYVEATDDLAGVWEIVASSINGVGMAGTGLVSDSDAGAGLKLVEVRDSINMQQAQSRFMRIRVTR
ncbi:IPT/TIG domain-containing protein [Prosthecobacter sp.]|uniref:IPT/TIG domain-containing protein n=1 Tax=Prosthecobacter sp. TaxID=1965333 RepID=UPI00262879CC|nr:IPT/TIG domain-containing protein [Prosthecobacter sp.]